MTSSENSLQSQINEQIVFLTKMAKVNADFNETLNLLQILSCELENSNNDLQQMNHIARKLEQINEDLRKQLKNKKRIG